VNQNAASAVSVKVLGKEDDASRTRIRRQAVSTRFLEKCVRMAQSVLSLAGVYDSTAATRG
jgi:hypothetical protein